MQEESIKWTNSSGDVTYLHGGSNITVLMGRSGLDNLPWNITRRQTPGTHGSVVTAIRGLERQITLPLLIQGTSPENFQEVRRQLSTRAVPSTDSGTLEFTSVDGIVRTIDVHYAGGLEGKDQVDNSNLLWQNITIRFISVNPFWYGAEISTTYNLTSGAGSDFLGDPFFPMRISSSTVIDSPTIDMLGDIESFPVFTITGPGADLILLNNSTGKALKLTNNGGYTLDNGEVIQIDCRPKLGKTVKVIDTQANLFSYLTKDSEFWGLEPGDNDVSLQINNATEVTQIELTYSPNHVGK